MDEYWYERSWQKKFQKKIIFILKTIPGDKSKSGLYSILRRRSSISSSRQPPSSVWISRRFPFLNRCGADCVHDSGPFGGSWIFGSGGCRRENSSSVAGSRLVVASSPPLSPPVLVLVDGEARSPPVRESMAVPITVRGTDWLRCDNTLSISRSPGHK